MSNPRKPRLSFTKDQRLDYAKLMVHEGYSCKQIEKISGAGPTAVVRWKKQYLKELDGPTPEGKKALIPEQQLPPIRTEPELVINTSNDLWPLYDLPGIDVTVGLKSFLGDQELYQKVLLHFYEDHMHDADNIKQNLKSNDKDKAKRLVHTIKGAASTLGAIKLYHLTVQLEAELKNEETQDVCLNEFQLLLGEVLSGITSLEKKYNHKEETVQVEHKINKTELTTIIQELSEKLLQASPQAIELVPQLSLALGKEYEETVEGLQEMVDAFDFDEALKKLKQIKKCIA